MAPLQLPIKLTSVFFPIKLGKKHLQLFGGLCILCGLIPLTYTKKMSHVACVRGCTDTQKCTYLVLTAL